MYASIRFACRRLLKTPGFTAAALLTLALGIGANTTAFTVLNRLLLKASSYPDSDRLVTVFSSTPQETFLPVSPADFCDLRDQNTVFESITCHCPGPVSLTEGGRPAIQLRNITVSSSFFRTLGVVPVLGRTFTQEEELRREPAAILSNRLWRDHFGADPSIIGRVIRIDAKVMPVVGVMPPLLDDPLLNARCDLWILDHPDINRNMRDRSWYYITARLKPGVTIDQARAETAAFAATLGRDFQTTDAGKTLKVNPYRQVRVGSTTSSLCWLTMAVTFSVLLIACANLANLQLVRATAQAKEHAIRLALGASRAGIVRLQLTESVILSLVGGALGLLVAKWGNVSAEKYLANYFAVDFPMDTKVIAFAFVASAFTGIAFGTIPALISSGAGMSGALKQNSRGSSSDRSRHRLRHSLIVIEIAVALTVLAGAGFFVQGMQRLLKRDMGWRPDNILTGEVVLSVEKYGDKGDERATQFGENLRRDLSVLPGVEQAVTAYTSPIWGYAMGGSGDGFAIEGRPPPEDGKAPQGHTNGISPHFFDTLGMHLVEGRDFTDADDAHSASVVIINAYMAKTFWPGESAIGKRIGKNDPRDRAWSEVVGVVNDTVAADDLGPQKFNFEIYRPFPQDPMRWINFIVHTSSNPSVLGEDARRAVAKLDPDVAVAWLETAQEEITDSVRTYSIVGRMLIQMAVLGLLLSAVGIYGVVASLAAERTQEIGIRMALGAQTGDVLWLILQNGVKVAVQGTAIGLALAFTLIYVLGRAMPEVPGQNTWIVLGLAALLAAIAIVACWLPARRATTINPIEALRSD